MVQRQRNNVRIRLAFDTVTPAIRMAQRRLRQPVVTVQEAKRICLPRTPIKTGRLRSRFQAIVRRTGVLLSWSTHYAFFVQVRGRSAGYVDRCHAALRQYISRTYWRNIR